MIRSFLNSIAGIKRPKFSTVRKPKFDFDGWCLESGEERHTEAPESFRIPDFNRRKAIQKGELAQLIFRMKVDRDDTEGNVERMWVVVTRNLDGGYLGILMNHPATTTTDEDIDLGIEVPFGYEHVIDIASGNKESRYYANKSPAKQWI
jgi:hypothetical protein